ncbi:TetR/AcrR family transcriptional regulator [Bacillus siamensis]|uniref:TetR/AcrR family transcriptional regulator n=1 Tax=Bacillus siamensis TaxID=659243 RepID=UPI002E1F5596|nr:TetR/AcrR family transcriptional regulator [Bacillus siamensis]MED5095541.1 TetR/AcrR family transcriptional regulator [Bacillus siamensis]
MTSNSPGKRKSEKTKKELIDVARDLFAKKGYSETSIRDILTAANISKGNLYHHFKGKEFLFLHIMEQDTQEWIDVWTEKNGQYKMRLKKCTV